jgi:hypothetical protein
MSKKSSDAVPALVRALGGPSGIMIGAEEFDRVFVVSDAAPGTTSVLDIRCVSS